MNPNSAPSRRPHRTRARRAQQRPWRQLTITVPPDETSLLSPIRRMIVVNLVEWGADLERAREVEVCASELLTNALLHSRGPARLNLTVHGHTAQLQVSDTSTQTPTTPGLDAEGRRASGRGLYITEALADAVDVQVHPGRGKTITASFALI